MKLIIDKCNLTKDNCDLNYCCSAICATKFRYPSILDAQAIAIKLSKQIEKVVKAIHKTLATVNELLNEEQQISYDDAKDPKNNIYDTIVENNNELPASVKRQIIQLFCLRRKCEEEQIMVRYVYMFMDGHLGCTTTRGVFVAADILLSKWCCQELE